MLGLFVKIFKCTQAKQNLAGCTNMFTLYVQKYVFGLLLPFFVKVTTFS